MTESELARLRHMSSIATYTNDKNRAFHHAMLDAGWIPIIGSDGIQEWGCYHPATLYSTEDAMKYYNEHGRMEPPTPF